MKIRNGFVSNSSSSSFIIAVPAGMELTPDNLHKVLYGTSECVEFSPQYEWHKNTVVTSMGVVADILAQIEHAEANKKAEDADDADSGDSPLGKVTNLARVVDDELDIKAFDQFATDKGVDWDAYTQFSDKAREQVANRLQHTFPNHDFYHVEFADDNAWGSEVEHGPALNNCENVTRYSHH